MHSHEKAQERKRGSSLRPGGQPNDRVRPAQVHRFTPTCVGTTAKIDGRILWYGGSPPRAWGQRAYRRPHISTPRGSPPRAWGQQVRRNICTGITAVHPHVRGDNVIQNNLKAEYYGSPPRAWGQRTSSCRPGGRWAVHPHVRGDNGRAPAWPRGRLRFTPTCVGTTTQPRAPRHQASRFTPTCVGTTARHFRLPLRLTRFTPTCVGTTA